MTASSHALPEGIVLRAPVTAAQADILSAEALAFLAELERRFDPERRRLLEVRAQRRAWLTQGGRPDFLPETRALRERDWQIAPLPADLQDRRVEITGPVDRKMIINGLNSGAKVFMADFEDASTPTWGNMLDGQINLRDAVNRSIWYEDKDSGKFYKLKPTTAVLMVRPRGWHLEEKHVEIDGQAISASLFDFGLFLFHNAHHLIAHGTGPYFYLPKLESHFEARLWNEVFVLAQQMLDLPLGTIKATVLIETLLAAFEIDEILHELQAHSAGLNCGRWDYIFSVIKTFRDDPTMVLPDRNSITMTTPFLAAYSRLAIATAHRRSAPAIGGMAAFIPVKDDPAANAVALAQVQADKEREAGNGHDGTWVAHPALVPVAQEVFDRLMPTPNQIAIPRDSVAVTAADLLPKPVGVATEAGLRNNIAVGIGYLESWLRGQGCVPLFNLMEDAATAEIARTQVWQWRRHGHCLHDGRVVDVPLIRALIAEETAAGLARNAGAVGRFVEAAALFQELVEAENCAEFLTLSAYDRLLAEGQ